MRKCRFCGEDIDEAATVCVHCGRDLIPDHTSAATVEFEPIPSVEFPFTQTPPAAAEPVPHSEIDDDDSTLKG